MEIYLDGQNIQTNICDLDSFQHIWQHTTELIYIQKRTISHVEIDGQTHYENYEVIFDQDFNKIKYINIFTISNEDRLVQLMQSISEYTPKFVDGTREISHSFYGELKERHWQQFSLFMEGLDWLYQSIEFSHMLMKQSDRINVNEQFYSNVLQKLEPIIGELEFALQHQDYVSVGDLMQYEIVPIFEHFMNTPVN